jgi:acyl-CoA hydrolase
VGTLEAKVHAYDLAEHKAAIVKTKETKPSRLAKSRSNKKLKRSVAAEAEAAPYTLEERERRRKELAKLQVEIARRKALEKRKREELADAKGEFTPTPKRHSELLDEEYVQTEVDFLERDLEDIAKQKNINARNKSKTTDLEPAKSAAIEKPTD